jgi:microcystin-dependent protein
MSEPFIGEIRIFAGNYAPLGWALCNGQLLPIQQYTALFSLLGTMYGGDGKTNFALPNLQGRAAMNAGTGPGLTQRIVGQTGGAEQVNLTVGQMAAHNHVPQCTGSATIETGADAIWAGARRGGGSMYAATASTQMSAAALDMAGGSMPHNNMQPNLPLNYIIALQGIFPQRP